MITLSQESFNPENPTEFLYSLVSAYLEHTQSINDEAMMCLNDEQHTLVAYCYLDSQIQEGGFVQLITEGYGEYIFNNPLADSLRHWKIKPTPKILDKAKILYTKYGEQIEHLAEQQINLDEIRKQFSDFEELDADYYDNADEDLAIAAFYVQENWKKFSTIHQ